MSDELKDKALFNYEEYAKGLTDYVILPVDTVKLTEKTLYAVSRLTRDSLALLIKLEGRMTDDEKKEWKEMQATVMKPLPM